jgi:hypothetical protein
VGRPEPGIEAGMSTTAIIVTAIMSLFVLTVGGGALVIAARMKPVGDEGRGSGRGPFHVASVAPGRAGRQRTAASIATATNSSAR